MSKIETRTVLPNTPQDPSLENCTFFIKDYQRGYRWEEQQVESLLDDLLEFGSSNNNTFKYCMQPLVVKKLKHDEVACECELSELITPDSVANKESVPSNDGGMWELIDGQQRLTTTLLILNSCYEAQKYPPAPPYQIYYNTCIY